MSNSTNPNLLILGTTTLLLGAGYWWYQKSKNENVEALSMTRDEVIKVLKRFKRNFYPVLKMLWTTVDKVVNSYKVRYGHVPESLKKNMDTIVMAENPQFHKLVEEMENEIYSEFNIQNRKGFEALSKKLYKTDPEIKRLMDEIKENVDKCCLGVSMNMEIPLPDYVTKEKSFEIYKSTAYSVQKSLKDFLVDYKKEHGTINPYDQEFNKQISECLSPNQIKRGLLRLNNYHKDNQYHEEYLFSASIKQFSKVDKAFEEAIKKIDVLNQQLIETQLRPTVDFDVVQTEIEKIMLVEIETPIIQEVASKDEVLNTGIQKAAEVKDIDELNDELNKEEDNDNKIPTNVPKPENVPKVPEPEEVPEVPKPENVPEVPNPDDVPEVPNSEDVQEVPKLDDIPDVPKKEETPDVPQQEDVPEVPEMKDVPDVANNPDVVPIENENEDKEEVPLVEDNQDDNNSKASNNQNDESDENNSDN